MAPGISSVYVYEAPNGSSWDSILDRIATDNVCKQISCSWIGGGPDSTAEGIFQQMAAQGQSFFTASGDSDADTGSIQFPADSPSITVVGGTTLTSTGAGGSYTSETVWNWGDGTGSSGGISTYYSIPTWQQGISMTANMGSTTMRNVPDVAMTADNIYVAYNNGGGGIFGGTSCAAPLWAAFTALVNQQSVSNTGSTVGFINPAVYAVGQGTGYASDFHDTTVGNNFSSSSPAKFPAETGYDLCTGWGTPNGTTLINALAGPPAPSITNGPPPSPAGLGIAYSFSFTSAGQPSPTFSLFSGGLPTGLNLSSTGVITGTPSQLGSFTATVQASNGIAPNATQTFTINVQSPAAPGFTDGPPTATAQVGSFYSFTYTGSGAPRPTFALYSGTLPPGLTLASTGLLSGNPTQSGVYSGSVIASNGVGSAVRQSFTITVHQAPAFANGPPPSPTTIGTSYNFTYSASGYPAPTFSVTAGNLPTGLNLSLSGVISGTTTQAGTFTGTVTASNGISPSASQAFSITVKPLSAPSFAKAPFNAITIINTALSFTYRANGTPSSTFSLSGTLPPGVSFSTSGLLSGTPTQIGVYSGTVTASNGISPNATQSYSITVFNNLVQNYSILHDFSDGSVPNDGNGAWASLIQGTDGNFYGTTVATDSETTGIAYEITAQGEDSVLHTFSDSSVPNVGRGSYASLVQSSGNFYGTTCYGGNGGGGVFEMTSAGVVTLLHLFGDGTVTNDGSSPFAPLILATDGNFYGTTDIGGSAGKGTVFRITPLGAVTILHSFGDGSVANDGANPRCALVQASDGSFYGTNYNGGTANQGFVFKMIVQGNTATMTILHSFGDGSVPNDGLQPQAPLIQASDGNFYGDTYQGGTVNEGALFKMTPQGVVTILHNCLDGSVQNDAYALSAGLIQGSDGNFYGTCPYGGGQGPSSNGGSLFRMTPQGVVTILHAFGSITDDGTEPYAPVVQGSDGSFYGTTLYGGTTTIGLVPGYGTVFKLALINAPTFTSAAGATFTVGQAGNFAVTAAGAPIFTASGLPTWASLNQSTGVLSGTPPNGSGGIFTITLTANNGVSPNASQTFTLTVDQSPAITSGPPPATTVNTAYGFTYTFSGYPLPTFSVTSGALPTGLTLAPNGVISGTPTVTGTFTGTVTASNGVGTVAKQSFSIAVEQEPSITNGPPSSGTLNTPYTFTYMAGGYPAPTFSLSAGTLPGGLALAPAGVLSGTPTVAGVFTGTVKASNGVSPDATQNFSLTIFSSLTQWEGLFFSVQQMQDVNTSGPNATPQHDGIPNLLKFLFDIDPAVPMSTTDKAALPQVALTTVANVSYLTLTYRQSPTASGITVNVQTSPDLQTWTTVTPGLSQIVGIDSPTGDPIMQVGVKAVGAKLFIRLNVTMP